MYQSLMTEKATIFKLLVYIYLQLFSVRQLIKTEEPQDENEGNRKIQLLITKRQYNLKQFRNECGRKICHRPAFHYPRLFQFTILNKFL